MSFLLFDRVIALFSKDENVVEIALKYKYLVCGDNIPLGFTSSLMGITTASNLQPY